MALSPLWRKIDVRIAVSQAARDTVETIFGPGARIIPNGVECATYAAVAPVDTHGRTVLYFGRLERRKGPQVLIQAAEDLLAKVPDARIVVAGQGPMESDLRAMVPEALSRSISFTGGFDETDHLALLSAATVVCLPAVGGESFGLTVVEALAAGRPLVASDIPGYAAVARDGIEAVLVPPEEPAALAAALAGLLTDPVRLKELAAAGRERARRFDWPLVAGEIEEVYREVLDRQRRNPSR
jgi:phosphatidylinositol alpha-mannosyltransferase